MSRRRKPIAPGDHLAVSRGLYTHHGIFVGDAKVFHLDGEPFDSENSRVRRTSLTAFAKGEEVRIVEPRRCFGAT